MCVCLWSADLYLGIVTWKPAEPSELTIAAYSGTTTGEGLCWSSESLHEEISNHLQFLTPWIRTVCQGHFLSLFDQSRIIFSTSLCHTLLHISLFIFVYLLHIFQSHGGLCVGGGGTKVH